MTAHIKENEFRKIYKSCHLKGFVFWRRLPGGIIEVRQAYRVQYVREILEFYQKAV